MEDGVPTNSSHGYDEYPEIIEGKKTVMLINISRRTGSWERI
jgi:hypothetical protein